MSDDLLAEVDALRAERDAAIARTDRAEAQLAALRAAAIEVLSAFPHSPEDAAAVMRGIDAEEAWDRVLADTAAAADECRERVRREATEAATAAERARIEPLIAQHFGVGPSWMREQFEKWDPEQFAAYMAEHRKIVADEYAAAEKEDGQEPA